MWTTAIRDPGSIGSHLPPGPDVHSVRGILQQYVISTPLCSSSGDLAIVDASRAPLCARWYSILRRILSQASRNYIHRDLSHLWCCLLSRNMASWAGHWSWCCIILGFWIPLYFPRRPFSARNRRVLLHVIYQVPGTSGIPTVVLMAVFSGFHFAYRNVHHQQQHLTWLYNTDGDSYYV